MKGFDLFGIKARRLNYDLMNRIVEMRKLNADLVNMMNLQAAIIEDRDKELASLKLRLKWLEDDIDQITFPNTEGFLDGGI